LNLLELKQQAGIQDNPDQEGLDLFAELIVKECVAIANRQFCAATGLDDRDCLTAHQMKQHFGVEE
jgi:hypothetical protein